MCALSVIFFTVAILTRKKRSFLIKSLSASWMRFTGTIDRHRRSTAKCERVLFEYESRAAAAAFSRGRQPTDILGHQFLAAQRRQRSGWVRSFGRFVEGDAWKSDEHGARDRVPAFAAARLVMEEWPYPSADADV